MTRHAISNYGPAVRFHPANGGAPIEVPHMPSGQELVCEDLPADVIKAIESQPAGLVKVRRVYP